MILYDFIPAPNPRRVRVFLHEKGIEVPTKQIDIMKGEHKKEDYKKLSPLSQIPTLKLDDGTCITESIAICRYFEALHPEPSLMGNNPEEIAVIEMWQRRLELLLMIVLLIPIDMGILQWLLWKIKLKNGQKQAVQG